MRIISLDFLRFLAAFSVAGPHLVIYFSLVDDPVLLETVTSLAVELFFVLSGFVLCPFLKKIFESTTGVRKNLLIFLVRRWMRTLPLYFLSLVFFIILFSGRLDLTTVKYLLFLQNFYWPPPEFDYFSVSWSLAVEEWFYILFPCFMALFFAFWGRLFGLKNRASIYVFGALGFVTVLTLLRVLSDAPVENWGNGLRRVVMFRLDSIGFGILLYLWRDRIYKIPVAVIFITAIAAAAYLFDAYDRISRGLSGVLEFRLLVFAATALFSCAVLAFFLRLESLFQGWMKGISLWGGRISYGVYLFHIPIGAIIGNLYDLSGSAFVVVTVLVIGIVTTLVYYFFEKPILEARPGFRFADAG